MKRSEINDIIRSAEAFLDEHRFALPPFSRWAPEDWTRQGGAADRIVERGLGWDITDFGSGAFHSTGLFLFTLRNGDPADLGSGRGMLYGEKLLIVEPDQLTPMHRHAVKTEDIINRGGGRLNVKLFASTPQGDLADRDVVVYTDGIRKSVEPGGVVTLQPGESITLTDGIYHAFWGTGARVLAGEVSLVNDDATDNYFYDDVGRFPTIEEDEPPYRLLVTDYERIGGRDD